MRKLSIILALVLVAGIFSGCSKPTVPIGDVASAIEQQVIADLKASGSFEDDAFAEGVPSYVTFDLKHDENTDFVMELDKSLIADGYALQAMMNVNSDKIILLKAKDKASVSKLQAALTATQEQQDSQWSWYLPNQYEKVKNNIIEVNGLYLLYVTYESPESIVQAVQDTLK